MQKKMGFWAVTALVAGSQIGSGIFLLPSTLSFYGTIGLFSWLFTATGAIFLALVFARLCSMIPQTGGPHVYIEKAFGRALGYFSAWTYWVISWVSTTMVVISVVSYLTPITGQLPPWANFVFELCIVASMLFLNLKGVKSAGSAEFVFTLLKLIPLILVPVAALFYFNKSHFYPLNPSASSLGTAFNAAALLTLWGFIGVESATAPAGAVDNPGKTIPKAIITGTVIVAIVYILSSVAIAGVLPFSTLSRSNAPFADAAQYVFGGSWHLLISVSAAIVCLGTLNAWVLTSGQIALGAANDGHFPSIFKKANRNGAPIWSLVISTIGMIPFLFFMLKKDFISQITFIIDLSVTAFLLIYALSSLSFLKLLKNTSTKGDWRGYTVGSIALIFCLWALYSAGLQTVILACSICLTGIPLYIKNKIS